MRGLIEQSQLPSEASEETSQGEVRSTEEDGVKHEGGAYSPQEQKNRLNEPVRTGQSSLVQKLTLRLTGKRFGSRSAVGSRVDTTV